MGCRGLANGGPQHGLDDDALIVSTDLLENIRRLLRVEFVYQRRIKIHHQAFAGRHIGGFLDGLRLDGHLIVGLQRVNYVYPLRQYLSRDAPEKRQHSHVARTHTGHC